MRICDLNTGLARLTHAFAELKERWGDVQGHWHDETSRQFEETHLQKIPGQLQMMLVAAQRLAEVLEQAEKECEEERGAM